ncbi:hypothetical protein F5Y03DRAFT_21948 [Xylaria venustula]|nr:hypothetical protein F5Y03DRAFT_21948 [Xylaria venustula]
MATSGPDTTQRRAASRVTMSVVALLAVALALLYQPVASLLSSSGFLSKNASSNAVSSVCVQLRDRFGAGPIVLPSDVASYTMLREENWSQTAWQDPACIAEPNTASEVGLLVAALACNNVPFAIRSGGQSPNLLDATIKEGVLISTANFNQVSYSIETGLVTLGPSARWDPVYTELDKHNKTMVGGRVMDVGVGGLSLGSGLSYLTDLYGLVCDNIVSYERMNQGQFP